MKIQHLNLANFCGFEQIEFNFEPDVTLFAGVNGIGKSAVIRALASAESYALPKISPSKESPISLADDDIQAGKSALSISIRFEANNHQIHAEVLRTKPDPSKTNELKKRRDEVRFAIRQTKKKSIEEINLLDELKYTEELLKGDGDHFSFHVEKVQSESEAINKLKQSNNSPLVIFYNTSRYLTRLPPRFSKSKPLNPASAYTKALYGLEVSLNDFAIWFRALESGELGSFNFSSELLIQLQKVLNSLLPGFKNIELQIEPKPRFFIEKNSTRLPLEQLSDGERGLIALAFDMTRRLALANPESENPIIEGKAAVLIDEIELHLHPLWQRQVLKRLKEIFANCQFIATTHSPLVLGEVEARCVRFLDRDDQGRVFCTVPNEAYGMDANRVLVELMGARVRTREMDDQLKVLFEQIDNEDFDAARQTMNLLRQKLGEHDPELTRASSLIKFLEGEE